MFLIIIKFLIFYLTAFTSNNALNLLKECKFPINSKWEELAGNIGIFLNEPHLAISQSLNSEPALEVTTDMFQRPSTRPVTWDMLTFISRVRSVDQFTETNIRNKLGIIAAPSTLYHNYYNYFLDQ